MLSSCSTAPSEPAPADKPRELPPAPTPPSAPTPQAYEEKAATAPEPAAPKEAAPTPPPAPKPAETPKAPATKTIELTARQFEFDPAVITVKKGDHVVIHAKSEDVSHGFALPDFGVNMALTPGDTKTIEFDATKAGEFEFFCSISCGRGHSGMNGKLIVEE